MNLWREPLPEFEGYVLEAKYARMNGKNFTDSQRDAFAVAERIAIRMSLADRVLISTPMWNFSIPYKLKQWFDVIIQPGLTFRFDPAMGYLPLLKDRPTLVIVASGGDFVTGMTRGPWAATIFRLGDLRVPDPAILHLGRPAARLRRDAIQSLRNKSFRFCVTVLSRAKGLDVAS